MRVFSALSFCIVVVVVVVVVIVLVVVVVLVFVSFEGVCFDVCGSRHVVCQGDSGLHCWNIVFSCWALYVLDSFCLGCGLMFVMQGIDSCGLL